MTKTSNEITCLKVLFIARRFPPSVGGMERFAFDLSCALEQQVELTKITWGGSNKWLPIVLPVFFFRAFWRLMIDKDIEVIHIQDGVQAPMGWLLSRIFHKPYIVVAHGLDITYETLGYQKIILPFVRRASHIVSISRATHDEALSRGVLKDRASVITLGAHDDYGTPVSNKAQLSKALSIDLVGSKLLLTTGRLVKRKGVEWFVRNALPAIVEHEQKVIYLVVGEGTEKDAIASAVQETGLQQQVKLLGRVDNKTRSLLYQSSDIFVMPNIIVPGDMEGFGIVALWLRAILREFETLSIIRRTACS
jgi:glycosyltransferase involved in cell wall biosynthesis